MTIALADETSPYLLQHAHNPVDWRPWSEAAFAAAKAEDKLVFREDYDGAEPAANHVAAENLLKLAVLFDEPGYATRAEAILRAGARAATTQPFAVPVLLGALDLFQRGVMRVEVRGEPRIRSWRWPCEGAGCRGRCGRGRRARAR